MPRAENVDESSGKGEGICTLINSGKTPEGGGLSGDETSTHTG